MKKIYEKPEAELLKFDIMDHMMYIGDYSSGIGDSDEEEED